MTNQKPPREWCIEPDFGDRDELFYGYALNYDPKQGSLRAQESRAMVIEKSAYDAVVQERDRLREHAEKLAEALDLYMGWANGTGTLDSTRANGAAHALAEYRKDYPK